MLRNHPHLQGLLLAVGLFAVAGAATPLAIDSMRGVTAPTVHREAPAEDSPAEIASKPPAPTLPPTDAPALAAGAPSPPR
jgi:hypothetical protein